MQGDFIHAQNPIFCPSIWSRCGLEGWIDGDDKGRTAGKTGRGACAQVAINSYSRSIWTQQNSHFRTNGMEVDRCVIEYELTNII